MKRTDWILCAAIVGIALLVRLPGLDAIYDWDEVDYVRAADLGLGANYLGTGVLDFRSFAEKGAIKALHLGDDLISVPPGYRADRDPLVLAHWHPPLLVYATAAARFMGGNPEWVARLPSLLFGLATVALLYVAAVMLLPHLGRSAGAAAALLLALMPVHVQASRVLSTHTMSSFWALAGVFFILWFRKDRNYAWLYAAAVTGGLTLLTTEFFPSLLGIAAVMIIVAPLVSPERASVRVSWHVLGLLATFALTVVIGWPGGLLKLAWLQTLLMRAYNLRVMLPEEQGWAMEFLRDRPGWSAIFVAALAWAAVRLRRHEARAFLYPVLIFSFLVFLGVLSIPFVNLVRAIPLIVPLCVIAGTAGAALWHESRPGRIVAGMVLAAVAIAAGQRALQAPAAGNDKRLLQYLQDTGPQASVLADGGHVYRYYLPSHAIVEFPLFEGPDALAHPEDFSPERSEPLRHYLAQRDQLANGEFDFLVLQRGRRLWDPELRAAIDARYQAMPAVSDAATLYRRVR